MIDSAPYLGNDHLHVGDSKGLDISYIGYTTLHSPKHIFTLSNVLHVPHITKLLLSAQKFCRDNHVYFECYASVFLCQRSHHQVLLSGQSNYGLYDLFESSVASIPQAFWSPCISATVDLWHRCLGHPTPHILNLLVFYNKIICTSRCSLAQCQACLLG